MERLLDLILGFFLKMCYNVFEIEKGCSTLEKLQPNLIGFELSLVRF